MDSGMAWIIPPPQAYGFNACSPAEIIMLGSSGNLERLGLHGECRLLMVGSVVRYYAWLYPGFFSAFRFTIKLMAVFCHILLLLQCSDQVHGPNGHGWNPLKLWTQINPSFFISIR